MKILNCNFRYFGLTVLKVEDDDDPRISVYLDCEWPSYANPVAIFLLYFVLALQGPISAPLKVTRCPFTLTNIGIEH